MSEQGFLPRLFVVQKVEKGGQYGGHLNFIAHGSRWISEYGEPQEYLSLTEHQHLMAEKDRRIERLREALRQIIVNAPDQSDPKNYNKYAFMACEALQEDGN